ncbi:hypothetical protein J4214_01270 [Candidatus Woesearchaeota archaeon]|nr:hypothetical protein [Candidatus Woesearchaeota archaeon]
MYRRQYTRGLGATKTLYPEVDEVLTCDYTLFGDPNAFDWTYFFKQRKNPGSARIYLKRQLGELNKNIAEYFEAKKSKGIGQIDSKFGYHIIDYSNHIKDRLEEDLRISLGNENSQQIEGYLLNESIKEFRTREKDTPLAHNLLFWKMTAREQFIVLGRDYRLLEAINLIFEKRNTHDQFKNKFVKIADIIINGKDDLIINDKFTPLLEQVSEDIARKKSDVMISHGLYTEAIELAKSEGRSDLLRESLLKFTEYRTSRKENLQINLNPVGLNTFETFCKIGDIGGAKEAYFMTEGKYGDAFYWWVLNKRYEKNFEDEIKQAKELFSKRQRIIDLLSEELKEQLFYSLVNKLYEEKDKTKALARAEILSKEFSKEIPLELVSRSALAILDKSHKREDIEKFLDLESNLVSRLSGNSKIIDKLKKRIEDGIDSIADKYPFEDSFYALNEQIWAVREYVRFSKCIGLPYPNQPYERSLFQSIKKIFSDVETSLSNSDDWNYEKFDSKIENVESALSKIEWILDVQEDKEDIKIAHILGGKGNRIIWDVKTKKRLKKILAEKKEKLKDIFK